MKKWEEKKKQEVKAKLKKGVSLIFSHFSLHYYLDAGDGDLDPKEAAQLLAIQVNSLKQKLGNKLFSY